MEIDERLAVTAGLKFHPYLRVVQNTRFVATWVLYRGTKVGSQPKG